MKGLNLELNFSKETASENERNESPIKSLNFVNRVWFL